jgi:hypothetical protein
VRGRAITVLFVPVATTCINRGESSTERQVFSRGRGERANHGGACAERQPGGGVPGSATLSGSTSRFASTGFSYVFRGVGGMTVSPW